MLFPSNFCFSGKGLLSKLGRKPPVIDDNRRATYNMSNQPVVRSESIFTTFEGEIKQLVAVCNEKTDLLSPLLSTLYPLLQNQFAFGSIRLAFMQNILMLGAWLVLPQHLVLLLGKLPPRGLNKHYPQDISLVVDGLENMSLFLPQY